MAKETRVDDEISFKLSDIQLPMGEAQNDDQEVLPVVSSESSVKGHNRNSGQGVTSSTTPVIQASSVPVDTLLDVGVPQVVRNRVTVRPETFDGSGDWEEYLTHFKICAKLGQWNDSTKVSMLAVNLKGSARRFYAGLSPEDQEKYEKVISTLAARYGCEKQREKFKAQLALRARKQGETAAELGDEIWRLVQRAYPNFDIKTQDQLALDAFLNALPVSLKVKCMEQACHFTMPKKL